MSDNTKPTWLDKWQKRKPTPAEIESKEKIPDDIAKIAEEYRDAGISIEIPGGVDTRR